MIYTYEQVMAIRHEAIVDLINKGYMLIANVLKYMTSQV